jgi:hypothetical protein
MTTRAPADPQQRAGSPRRSVPSLGTPLQTFRVRRRSLQSPAPSARSMCHPETRTLPDLRDARQHALSVKVDFGAFGGRSQGSGGASQALSGGSQEASKFPKGTGRSSKVAARRSGVLSGPSQEVAGASQEVGDRPQMLRRCSWDPEQVVQGFEHASDVPVERSSARGGGSKAMADRSQAVALPLQAVALPSQAVALPSQVPARPSKIPARRTQRRPERS